tara:strand:+ start:615 stop:1034 length:420 start_codon:yes stop_codon:yes gene_type:complete
MSYQVIKLANGEDIVCNLVKRFGSKIEVTSPLRMDTISKETDKGVMESLALSRWVQPYSDEKVFNIESNSVVIMTPASVGLSRYYEYVLKNIKKDIVETPPTKKELKVIEEEELDLHEEIFSSEDLQKILNKFSKKTIH